MFASAQEREELAGVDLFTQNRNERMEKARNQDIEIKTVRGYLELKGYNQKEINHIFNNIINKQIHVDKSRALIDDIVKKHAEEFPDVKYECSF